MASSAKRKRTDTAGVEDAVAVDLLSAEVKQENHSNYDLEEPSVIYFKETQMDTPNTKSQVKIELSLEPLTVDQAVQQVPLEPRIAAESTSELLIRDPSEDEQDCDFDLENSISEESENEQEDDLEADAESWNHDSESMVYMPFIKRKTVLEPIQEQGDPYDIFRLIIDDEFLDLAASGTNIAGRKDFKDGWQDVTREELLTFIGLIIHTGTVQLSRLSDYWNTHYLFNIKCFSKFMERNRFLQILKCLSFSDSTTQEDIKPIIDQFNNKMKIIYYPGMNLTVRESMAFQRGRLHLNGSLNVEKYKFVTSLHVLAEDGIALQLEATYGVVDYERVVLDLLDEKLDNGHSVYMSEQYNSIKLASKLLKRYTHCTGPIKKKYVPSEISKNEIQNLSFYRNGVHLCKMKKTIFMSTLHDEELIHTPTKRSVVIKPKPMIMYHRVMMVDGQEDLLAYYPCRLNNLRLHKKVFIHVLQLAMQNAFHLCAKFKRRVTKTRFYDFRLEVLEKLLPDGPSLTRITSSQHMLTKIDKLRLRERNERGRVTLRKEVVRKECQGCKLKKKRTTTTYECRQCDGSPGYCTNCFCRMHNLNITVLDDANLKLKFKPN